MPIECLVIDDEPLARKGLANFIQEVPFLHLADMHADPVEALPALTAGGIDLLFLDIRMPKMTGLDLLRTLPDPPLTIIATAFPHHALEAFDLQVADYLVKPIPFERFVKAATRAKELLELRGKGGEAAPAAGDHFFIKCESRYERIRFDELLYVEALQNYVVLHTTARRYISYLTFKAVEDYLPAGRFLKVHKSYIVALARVERIDGAMLDVAGAQVPISRTNKEEVLQAILKDRLLKR